MACFQRANATPRIGDGDAAMHDLQMPVARLCHRRSRIGPDAFLLRTCGIGAQHHLRAKPETFRRPRRAPAAPAESADNQLQAPAAFPETLQPGPPSANVATGAIGWRTQQHRKQVGRRFGGRESAPSPLPSRDRVRRFLLVARRCERRLRSPPPAGGNGRSRRGTRDRIRQNRTIMQVVQTTTSTSKVCITASARASPLSNVASTCGPNRRRRRGAHRRSRGTWRRPSVRPGHIAIDARRRKKASPLFRLCPGSARRHPETIQGAGVTNPLPHEPPRSLCLRAALACSNFVRSNR
jgi:hypothetical protein